MEAFLKKVEIRWSDLDPNYHLRHSVYYDYGAYCRISYLNENGITPALMVQHDIGPILFREECVFKKEIRFGDVVTINLKLARATPNISRWTMVHEIYTNNATLAAIITIDGAWLNTSLRKLATPPDAFRTAFGRIPRTDKFKQTEQQ